MKLYTRFIFLALITLSIASCKKDSTSAPKMSAVIDGKTWSPSDLGVGATFSSSTEYLKITGTDLTSSLVIIIHGKTIGTYSLSLTSQQCEAIYTPLLTSPTGTYLGITGTVKLTKVSANLISGTFEFTLSNGKIIKEGQFNDVLYL